MINLKQMRSAEIIVSFIKRIFAQVLKFSQKIFYLIVFLFVALLNLSLGNHGSNDSKTSSSEAQVKHWYRGNTHAHVKFSDKNNKRMPFSIIAEDANSYPISDRDAYRKSLDRRISEHIKKIAETSCV